MAQGNGTEAVPASGSGAASEGQWRTKPPADPRRLSRLRTRVAAGEYAVNAARVARRMLESEK